MDEDQPSTSQSASPASSETLAKKYKPSHWCWNYFTKKKKKKGKKTTEYAYCHFCNVEYFPHNKRMAQHLLKVSFFNKTLFYPGSTNGRAIQGLINLERAFFV
jgi:hypothetical protein